MKRNKRVFGGVERSIEQLKDKWLRAYSFGRRRFFVPLRLTN